MMKATSETVFFVTIERIFLNIFFLFFSFLLLPLPPRFSAEYTFCCGRQSGAGREGGREGLVRGEGRTLHVICFVIGAWEGGY